jgi:hypothetical protein
MPKALTVIDGVAGLDQDLARAVADTVLGRAPRQTTGELRAAMRRAVLAADPAAAQQRRAAAAKDARVELWDEPAGTKALAGRDLPPAGVLAADNRISAIARELKNAGACGSLDLLRAKVYLALLVGQPLDTLLPAPDDIRAPASHAPGAPGPGTLTPPAADSTVPARPPGPAAAADTPGDVARIGAGARSGTDIAAGGAAAAGADAGPAVPAPAAVPADVAPWPAAATWGDPGLGRLTGSVNLTVPLTTLLDLAGEPGEVAGFGPVDAGTSRTLAGSAACHPATRWCLSVTDEAGRVIGHGCRRRERASPHGPGQGSPAAPAARELVIKIDRLAFPDCGHRREAPGYQLPARLRHIIEIRDRTCSFPGCRRPAARCDKDHTVPYDRGGKTCECNCTPLCRAHHRVKQASGWHVEQLAPGVLQWTTPAGRKYITGEP